MNNTISIHQPNFLPWLGYFNKIALSDTFVFFDDVQFPRSKTFGNRALIKTNNGELWITVPVLGKSDLLNFNEIKIDGNHWVKKALKTISLNYSKAPFYDLIFPELENVFKQNNEKLIDLNVSLMKFALSVLKAETKLVYSSDLCKDMTSNGEDKILHILEKLNATTYISGSGSGSKRYISEEEFLKRNINLVWQEFQHPEYAQLWGDFIPNLSIIDLLFNYGDESRKVLLNL